MSPFRVPLIRWKTGPGEQSLIHILDPRSHRAFTLCGRKAPPRTVDVYTSEEDLMLTAVYDLCRRCRRSFGVPLTAHAPRSSRRLQRNGARAAPRLQQLELPLYRR